MKYLSLVLFFFLMLNSCQKEQVVPKKIKSITKAINDSILEKKEFDINQNLIFEYHNQIDFGHDNSIIFITAYESDSVNNKQIIYYANSRSDLKLTVDSFAQNKTLKNKKIGIYDKLEDSPNYWSQLYNSNSKEKFINFFKTNYPSDLPFKYSYEYSDSIKTEISEIVKNDTIIIETKKIQDDFTIDYSKVYYFPKDKKNKEIVKGEYNRLIEKIYDKEGRLIRENQKGQHYQYYYDGDLLVKKEMYHGNDLAFVDEYFYENDILVKEIKHRITESKYFLRKPKHQTVLYYYEYY